MSEYVASGGYESNEPFGKILDGITRSLLNIATLSPVRTYSIDPTNKLRVALRRLSRRAQALGSYACQLDAVVEGRQMVIHTEGRAGDDGIPLNVQGATATYDQEWRYEQYGVLGKRVGRTFCDLNDLPVSSNDKDSISALVWLGPGAAVEVFRVLRLCEVVALEQRMIQ